MSKLKYSTSHVTATHDENPPGGKILHMMGSLFLVQVQKNPGTEFNSDNTDNKDSNSYSSEELLWFPTEKVTGETFLFTKSVWSDEEDYVFLSNSPRGAVVL